MAVVVIVFWLAVAVRTFGQDLADMSDTTDTGDWKAETPQWVVSTGSDFRYTLADLDSLVRRSPQVVLLKEQIRVRNEQGVFWRSISLHMTYNPVREDAPAFQPNGWLGFSLPMGRLFQNTRRLDEAELAVVVQNIRVQARELMAQREELLVELGLAVQQYQTARLKAQKAEVSLAVHQTSSDAVLEARDALVERLAAIQKTKLSIRLVEDRLKALIGER